MKKAVSLILASLLTLGILSGCGSSNTPTTTTTETAATSAPSDNSGSEAAADTGGEQAAEPESGEKITLKIWGYETPDNDLNTNVHTTAYEEMTGVHVEWDLFSTSMDGDEAFNLMIASKDYPDIIAAGLSTDRVKMLIEGNIALPLNDYIVEGTNYKEVLDEMPIFREMVTTPDGNIYTFFYSDAGVHAISEYKLFVYNDWLDQLNMEPPTTTEGFKEMLVAFTENDLNGNGINDELGLVGCVGGRHTDPICFLMNPFQLYNQELYNISDDGNVEFIFNTDGWREGLKYINDLYTSGLILEETYVQDETQFNALLNKPKGETIVGSFSNWVQLGIDRNVLDWTDYQALAPLEGPTGLRQSAAKKEGFFMLDTAITTACKNPDAAFEWLDWFLSKDGLMFLQFGVEGITYEWDDAPSYDGQTPSVRTIPQEKRVLWDASFFPWHDRAEVRYRTVADESLRNTDNTYVLFSAAELYEPYYVWHNVPSIVWCSDNDVIDKKADYKVLFKEYVENSYTEFIVGKRDIHDDAEWENYLATLERMGLQDYYDTLMKYHSN